MGQKFSCREISGGVVEGEALLCADQILFYHTDPDTGIITERGHALEGISIKNKILIFPGGKGSSVVQMDGLYKLEQRHTAPLGFIVREPDTVLVSSAIIMELPMVDRVEESFYRIIRNGDRIRIDTGRQIIERLEARSGGEPSVN
ncbi:DUF126 domain-containing protein [Oscillibacter sp. GMB15532]|uniref:aconitase X swivel domain-containing protein n=1 Tax=Oscillibacter sp. GMB15532 TaxID=3230022 RepID=UPI0034DF58F1